MDGERLREEFLGLFMIFFCNYPYIPVLISTTSKLTTNIFYFFDSLCKVCLWQYKQYFCNSSRVGVLRRFLRVVYREIPVDLPSVSFRIQLVHSKAMVTLTSLLLAIDSDVF